MIDSWVHGDPTGLLWPADDSRGVMAGAFLQNVSAGRLGWGDASSIVGRVKSAHIRGPASRRALSSGSFSKKLGNST